MHRFYLEKIQEIYLQNCYNYHLVKNLQNVEHQAYINIKHVNECIILNM